MSGMSDFRDHFPMLGHTVHLAGCSLGARSVALDAAMGQMLEDMGSGGAPWELFERQVGQARAGFAELIGADPEQVAVVPNASVGAYQVASVLRWSQRPGIVTTTAEFPSLAHVWLAQEARGAQVRFAGTAADYERLVDHRTGLVSVPATTYEHAVRQPVEEITRAAKDVGARVLVDAYQAVGVEPVDVRRLGCDFLVAGTMKYLLGLPGLAFLYTRDPADIDQLPTLTGWFGRRDPFAFDPQLLDFSPTATRFETGTPAIPACYAANAGLGLIRELDPAQVRAHIGELTALTEAALVDAGHEVVQVDPQFRGAHVSLLDPDPARLTRWLADRNIIVSPRGRAVRISFHRYNNDHDVAELITALARYRTVVGEPAGKGLHLSKEPHVHR
jgi:selenocysteine lyase/cysteine desulfurase